MLVLLMGVFVLIFDQSTRVDYAPRKPNEAEYGFLNRSAGAVFAETRDLLQEWADRYPASGQHSLIKSMQSPDDHDFESAFWELYLHEAYRRAGYQLTVHPEVPDSSKHPDFLVENGERRFYLEAVRANVSAEKLAEKRRLGEVHTVLEDLPADKFKLRFSYDAIGLQPLATTKLRAQLMQWLASLDPGEVIAAYTANPMYPSLPCRRFVADGWILEFTALPLGLESAGKGGRLVGVFGRKRASGVDNVSPLKRAVDQKAKRYGILDAPLVVAVLANTEYPTRDYQIQEALYGVSALPPREASRNPSDLYQDGHWLTRKGWRRGHAPQVITACDLKPWFVARVQPRLWGTLESEVEIPSQPPFLARVKVDGPDPAVMPAQPMSEVFGLAYGGGSGEAFR
ncbi:hypothetical protein ACGFJ7_35625 [Actinoplanes sp. NPDC048988]|uniref:hypothetical protein n=1 Tax=Actinoplanes sp. NPDC048988 TaxID=3363901 RepID=UPI003710EAD0